MSSTLMTGANDIAAIVQGTKTPYQLTTDMLDKPLDRKGTLLLEEAGRVEFVGAGDEISAAPFLQAGERPIYVRQINSLGTDLDVSKIWIMPC